VETITAEQALDKLQTQLESVADFGNMEEQQGLEYLSVIRAALAINARHRETIAQLTEQLRRSQKHGFGWADRALYNGQLFLKLKAGIEKSKKIWRSTHDHYWLSTEPIDRLKSNYKEYYAIPTNMIEAEISNLVGQPLID
jgi:hypothetical protein